MDTYTLPRNPFLQDQQLSKEEPAMPRLEPDSDLLEGLHEWRPVQEIVRLTFKVRSAERVQEVVCPFVCDAAWTALRRLHHGVLWGGSTYAHQGVSQLCAI